MMLENCTKSLKSSSSVWTSSAPKGRLWDPTKSFFFFFLSPFFQSKVRTFTLNFTCLVLSSWTIQNPKVFKWYDMKQRRAADPHTGEAGAKSSLVFFTDKWFKQVINQQNCCRLISCRSSYCLIDKALHLFIRHTQTTATTGGMGWEPSEVCSAVWMSRSKSRLVADWVGKSSWGTHRHVAPGKSICTLYFIKWGEEGYILKSEKNWFD